MHGRTDAIKVAVFVQRRLRAAHHAVQVRLLEQGRIDAESDAFLVIADVLFEGISALGHDGRDTVLRLRQDEQGYVHQVVAVQIRIEDEIRRIAGVRDHRAHIGNQVEVLLGARRRGETRQPGGQLAPLPFQRCDPRVFPLALSQTFVGELESLSIRGLPFHWTQNASRRHYRRRRSKR